MGRTFTTKIIEIGPDAGFIIPDEISEEFGLHEGDEIEMIIEVTKTGKKISLRQL